MLHHGYLGDSRDQDAVRLRGYFGALHSTVGDAFTEHVVVGKIFVAKKYLVTPSPSVFKLHQNGVEFNQKSKSDLTKLWTVVGQ